jgi:hypothetical protein
VEFEALTLVFPVPINWERRSRVEAEVRRHVVWVQTVLPVPNPVAADTEQTGGLWVRVLRSVPWFTFRIESAKVDHNILTSRHYTGV